MHVSTSIRVDEETKARLERLKRDEETWSEFLDRLVTESGSMQPGAWAGTDKAERAREARSRTRESFE
jgi:predicted CopG family antitoxin